MFGILPRPATALANTPISFSPRHTHEDEFVLFIIESVTSTLFKWSVISLPWGWRHYIALTTLRMGILHCWKHLKYLPHYKTSQNTKR